MSMPDLRKALAAKVDDLYLRGDLDPGVADELRALLAEAPKDAGLREKVARYFYENWMGVNLEYYPWGRTKEAPITLAKAFAGADHILALVLPSPDALTVEWTEQDEEDSNYWKCNGCGDEFVFNDGTPQENGAIFCHHCGGRITKFNVYALDDEEETP